MTAASRTSPFSRAREDSLTALLPYWEIQDGLVVLNDGRVEVGVRLELPPTLFVSTAYMEGLVGVLKALLRSAVPEGSRARLVVEVSPAHPSRVERYREMPASHPVARFLQEKRYEAWKERWARGEVLERRVYLSVLLGKPRHKRRRVPFTPEEWKEVVGEAVKVRERVVQAASSYRIPAFPMDDQELFAAIYRYFNPALALAEVPRYQRTWQRYPREAIRRIPSLRPPTLRAQVARSEVDNSYRDALYLGGMWAGILSLYTVPDETYAEMGDVLARAGGSRFYLVMDFLHEPFELAIRALKARARRYYSASQSGTYVDPNVRVGQVETEGAITHVSQTGDHIFQVGVSLVLLERERQALEGRTAQAMSELSRVPGNPFRVLRNGLLTPWLTLAPFSGGIPEERVYLLETNAAHFFPTTGAWAGSPRPVALFRNRQGALVQVDPFDKRMRNYNGVVVGGSGSGKTFSVQYLLSELLRDDKVSVVILDRGRNYQALVEAFGGAMVDIRPGAGTSINPFDLEEGEVEPTPEKKGDLLKLLRAMVPPGDDPTAEAVENAILEAAIAQTYARATTVDLLEDGTEAKRYLGARLSDLVKTLLTLDEIGGRGISPTEKEVARSLALRLQSWTGDSPLGTFVDRPTSVPVSTARVVCYELEGLDAYEGLDVVGTVLMADLIWKRAKEGKRRGEERNLLVVLDEAWKVFKNPYAASLVEELYRRFRHLGGGIWSITQSLQDFSGDSAGRIVQNTTWVFLFRVQGEEAYVKEVFGLPDRAMAVWQSLGGVKGLYGEVMVWCVRDDRKEGDVLQLWPTPYDYWLFTSAQEEAAKRKALAERYGDVLRAVVELAEGRAP
ncbi:helicase HerA domain-containing protein [Thermus sp.]|uniref:TraG/VirB4 family ATPase n=1 Tax=Thermus sp. TaxID=275 RepID=UPI003D0F1B4F